MEQRLIPSNASELEAMLTNSQAKIKCKNLEERRQVLQALMDAGFPIYPVTAQYLDPNRPAYNDFDYPHPGWNIDGGYINCWNRIASGDPWIAPEDVIRAFDATPEYTPEEEWFNASISELFGIC